MNVSHVTLPYSRLAALLDLPDEAMIVSVSDHDMGAVVLRIVAPAAPMNFSVADDDPISVIGRSYRIAIEQHDRQQRDE